MSSSKWSNGVEGCVITILINDFFLCVLHHICSGADSFNWLADSFGCAFSLQGKGVACELACTSVNILKTQDPYSSFLACCQCTVHLIDIAHDTCDAPHSWAAPQDSER